MFALYYSGWGFAAPPLPAAQMFLRQMSHVNLTSVGDHLVTVILENTLDTGGKSGTGQGRNSAEPELKNGYITRRA